MRKKSLTVLERAIRPGSVDRFVVPRCEHWKQWLEALMLVAQHAGAAQIEVGEETITVRPFRVVEQ